jgi:protein O-mannosyl-transferase
MSRKKRSQPPPPVPSPAPVLVPGTVWSWVPVLLAGLTVLVFLPAVRFGFLHWDDHHLIFQNPLYTQFSWSGMLVPWRAQILGFYIPVTYTAWAIQHALWGFNANAFHAVNVLLHALNVALVFLVVRAILDARDSRVAVPDRRQTTSDRPGSVAFPLVPVAAACAALLFAVHPVQVEPVAWLSDLKDLLATFFTFLAVHAYFRPSRRTGRLHRIALYGAGWFLLALLSKPAVAVFGPVVLVLDVALRHTPWRTALRHTAAWLVLAVPFTVITKLAQPDAMFDYVAPLWLRPFVALDTLQFYAVKLVAPVRLAPEYGRTPQWLLESGAWRWSWVVPAIVGALLGWAAWRRRFVPLVLVAAFVLALGPVLGLVPFFYQRFSTVADHYLYAPFLLVTLGVALALVAVPPRHRRTGVVAVLALCTVCTVLTVRQLRIWQTDDTFFPYAIAHDPRGPLLRMNYGQALQAQGRYEDAIEQYRAGADIRPHPDLYYNIASALFALKRYDEAETALLKAIELNPTSTELQGRLEQLRRVRARQ